MKTNAVRVLDRLGIKYELRDYEVDPNDLSAETVAAKVGLPPEQLFKTLAVRSDRNEIYLVVIPANEELDFKVLAQLTGNRKIDMLPLKEVQAATGYIRGGVTALACKRDYPVYIDELVETCDVISVSAGHKGFADLAGPARLHPRRQRHRRRDCKTEVVLRNIREFILHRGAECLRRQVFPPGRLEPMTALPSL